MPSPMIEIPPGDIFKNDRLGLEPAIQGRTHALLARSPQAIAIDGRWGTGKSTFLALWDAYLQREGVKVVQFNAWKTFGADPFDALTREILRQVDAPDAQLEGPHRRILAFLTQNAPLVAQGAKLASALHPELEGISQTIEAGLSAAAKLPGTDAQADPEPAIDSPEAFAAILSAAAKSWSDRPVVVMVDELDRCSPEYAVEFLQLLEHVFHAKHVVFVVAVNRSELQHSIRAFYGQGFNAEGYLERFFDDILALPVSRRLQYIGSSIRANIPVETSNVTPLLDASALSLREIDKSIQVLKSIFDNRANVFPAIVELWVARTLAPASYRRFITGNMSDKQLVDAVFTNGNCSGLRTGSDRPGQHSAQRLEAILIMYSHLLLGGSRWTFSNDTGTESQLFRVYQEIVENNQRGDVTVEYAQGVLSLTSTYAHEFMMTPFAPEVEEVVQTVRLLERDLPPESVTDTS